MNKYRNTELDIHKRIYRFIVNCFRDIVRKIHKSPENMRIINQLSGSLTSIGANDQEADASFTRKDFIAKYSIVRKEAKETQYWLSFIRDSGLVSPEITNPYIAECVEIRNIVSSIIENSQR